MGITNAQYDEIMRQYDRKRIESAHRLDERAAKVYEMIPEYSDIEEQIKDVAFECGIKSIEGDEEALSEMKRTIEELGRRKTELLVMSGFGADYLEPDFSCPDCKDTGYIGPKKCHCLNQRILEILYSKSNVGEVLEKENFDRLSYDYYSDEEIEIMEPVIEKCKDYVRSFDDSYENLWFSGKPGIGKTFLSNCITKALLDRGHSVIYFTSVQLFDKLSKYVFSYDHDESEENMMEDLYACDLLIIDDLGTETVSNFVASQLFNVINERDIRKKATIISTNLSLSDITERYTERVLSRLAGKYTLIKPEISDIRFKSRMAGQ